MIIGNLGSLGKCWTVSSVCVSVCVSLYFVMPDVQGHFSISIIKGNSEKCKWQARKSLVLPNYKR